MPCCVRFLMRALSFIRINSQEDRRPKRNQKELNKIGARLCEQFQPPTCCNILFGVVCDWTMSRRNTTWWLCGTDRVPLLKVVHNFSGFHDLQCFFMLFFRPSKSLKVSNCLRTCKHLLVDVRLVRDVAKAIWHVAGSLEGVSWHDEMNVDNRTWHFLKRSPLELFLLFTPCC